MSWTDFRALIQEANTDPKAWARAIEANPNSPDGALAVAIFEVMDTHNVGHITSLAEIILSLARQAGEVPSDQDN